MALLLLLWVSLAAAELVNPDYEVLQMGPSDGGSIYVMPHFNGGRPDLDDVRTIHYYKSLGMLDAMRQCNAQSSIAIYNALCKLLEGQGLSTIFGRADSGNVQLNEDGCYPASWYMRYTRILHEAEINLSDISSACDDAFKGKRANLLYGTHFPNPHGLFLLQHRDVSLCPLELRMPYGASVWDQVTTNAAWVECCDQNGSDNCSDLFQQRMQIAKNRQPEMKTRFADWFTKFPGAVVALIHPEWDILSPWPENASVYRLLPSLHLHDNCSAKVYRECSLVGKRNEL